MPTRDLLDEIKTKWNIPVTLPMAVPWGKDDVVWLVQEVERLRKELELAATPPAVRRYRQVEAMLRVALTDRTDEWTIKSVDERVSILLSMFTKEKP
jgi:hypothetical protein